MVSTPPLLRKVMDVILLLILFFPLLLSKYKFKYIIKLFWKVFQNYCCLCRNIDGLLKWLICINGQITLNSCHMIFRKIVIGCHFAAHWRIFIMKYTWKMKAQKLYYVLDVGIFPMVQYEIRISKRFLNQNIATMPKMWYHFYMCSNRVI